MLLRLRTARWSTVFTFLPWVFLTVCGGGIHQHDFHGSRSDQLEIDEPAAGSTAGTLTLEHPPGSLEQHASDICAACLWQRAAQAFIQLDLPGHFTPSSPSVLRSVHLSPLSTDLALARPRGPPFRQAISLI